MRRWGLLPILGLYSLFPLTFILGKKGFFFGPPLLFISLRMILSGTVLLLRSYLYNKNSIFIKRSDWPLIFQGTFFGIFLAYAPEFWALKYLSAAKVAFLFILAPFFSFIFEFLENKESITKQKFLGMITAFCGVVPILLPSEVYQHTITPPIAPFFLELIVIACVASYAFGWFSVKELTHKKKYSSFVVTGFNMLFGGILCLLLSFMTEPTTGFCMPVTHWYLYGWYIVLISIVGTSCYSLYALLLKYYSTTFVSCAGFIEPFFAALYGKIFLSETVSWIFFASTVIVGAGLYTFYMEELRINP